MMDLKPVFQVMDIRIVQNQVPGTLDEKKERYRVMLSDGSFYLQGMLDTHLNELIRSKQLQKGSIVQLTEFVCNTICNRVYVF